MFKLVQSGPTGGDCTAPYDVLLNGEYTVEQFIHDVLLDEREWGRIGIYDSRSIFGNPSCEYRYGELVSKLPDEYLKLNVTKARASGGWSLMDYILTVEPVCTSIFPVTKHYGIQKEYGDTWYIVYRLPDEQIAKFKHKESAINECKYQERLDAVKENK